MPWSLPTTRLLPPLELIAIFTKSFSWRAALSQLLPKLPAPLTCCDFPRSTHTNRVSYSEVISFSYFVRISYFRFSFPVNRSAFAAGTGADADSTLAMAVSIAILEVTLPIFHQYLNVKSYKGC